MSTEKKLTGSIIKTQSIDKPTSVVGQILKSKEVQLTGSVRVGNRLAASVTNQSNTVIKKAIRHKKETSLDGRIDSEQPLPANLVDESTMDLSKYTGPTVITPLPFQNTVLETRGKVVYRNINVLEIPYYETSNVSGKTVYIGGEY